MKSQKSFKNHKQLNIATLRNSGYNSILIKLVNIDLTTFSHMVEKYMYIHFILCNFCSIKFQAIQCNQQIKIKCQRDIIFLKIRMNFLYNFHIHFQFYESQQWLIEESYIDICCCGLIHKVFKHMQHLVHVYIWINRSYIIYSRTN